VHPTRLAPQHRFALPAALLVGLAQQRRDRSRPALVVQRDEHQEGGRHVRPPSGDRILGLDPDPDVERGGPDRVHRREEREELPDVHGFQERELVHRHGHAQGPRVPDRRERSRRVRQTHHHAPVDVAGDVRVGDLHQLRQGDACLRGGLGLQPIVILHGPSILPRTRRDPNHDVPEGEETF
jgi:hypothetical protein